MYIFFDFERTVVFGSIHNFLIQLGINPRKGMVKGGIVIEKNDEFYFTKTNKVLPKTKNSGATEEQIRHLYNNQHPLTGERMDTLYGPKNAKRFIELIIKHMDEGKHQISIVSYSQYPEVIKGILKLMFEQHAPQRMDLLSQIVIVCGFPDDLHHDGKEKHIGAAIEYYEEKLKVKISPQAIALMDDDKNNVSIAQQRGHIAILAPSEPHLPAQFTLADFGNLATLAAAKTEEVAKSNNNNSASSSLIAHQQEESLLKAYDFDQTLVWGQLHNLLVKLRVKPNINNDDGIIIEKGEQFYFQNTGQALQEKSFGATAEQIKRIYHNQHPLTGEAMNPPIGPKDSKRFVELAIQDMEKGHKIAIVSYTLYPEVIKGIVKLMFEEQAPHRMELFNQIIVVCGFPQDMAKDGKEKHLNAAAQYCEQKYQIKFPAHRIALMDDSETNIKIAQQHNHPTVLAPSMPGLAPQFTRMNLHAYAAMTSNNNSAGSSQPSNSSLGKRAGTESKDQNNQKMKFTNQ